MKLKHLLIVLIMMASSLNANSLWLTSATDKSSNTTHTSAVSQEEEHNNLKEKVEDLEKSVDKYSNDLNAKTVEINGIMDHWLVLLSIIIGALVTIAGVIVPLFIQLFNRSYYNEQVKEVKEKAHKAAADAAQSAKDALSANEALNKILEHVERSNQNAQVSLEHVAKVEEAFMAINELKKQIQIMQEQTKKDSENASKSAKEAEAYQLFVQALSEKDPNKAIKLYDEAIELNPNFAKAYIKCGRRKAKLQEPDHKGAIDYYNRAIEINPEDSSVYRYRGELKKDLGNYEGAMQDFNKAIELNSKDDRAYRSRGELRRKLNDNRGALQDFNIAIELNPNDPTTYYVRGDLKLILGKPSDAEYDFKKARDLELGDKKKINH